MSDTVLIIWGAALALALVLTALAVAQLLHLVRLCGEILTLARAAAVGAEGIARHTSSIGGLAGVVGLAPTLLSVCGGIDAAAAKIGTTLESVAPKEA